jgi:hypothetical protein
VTETATDVFRQDLAEMAVASGSSASAPLGSTE